MSRAGPKGPARLWLPDGGAAKGVPAREGNALRPAPWTAGTPRRMGQGRDGSACSRNSSRTMRPVRPQTVWAPQG